ncbi:MAG: hypothetical protein J6X69_02330 [Bacteroidales bacterium]|nr:hypothetical protein [Bacteroidales bacterium]
MSETRENGKPWWPEELITREQAIASLPLNVARQMLDKQEEKQPYRNIQHVFQHHPRCDGE